MLYRNSSGDSSSTGEIALVVVEVMVPVLVLLIILMLFLIISIRNDWDYTTLMQEEKNCLNGMIKYSKPVDSRTNFIDDFAKLLVDLFESSSPL